MRIGNRVKHFRGEWRGSVVAGPRRASRGMAWVLWDSDQEPAQVNRAWLRLDQSTQAKQIITKANVLPNGAVSVGYSVGRIYGAVMFDKDGRYEDATRQTQSTKGRGFCEQHELPTGVLEAARVARRAAIG